MKILFVIKSNGRGVGGHYRSLKVISDEIGKYLEYDILVFGKQKPIALSDTNYSMIFFGRNIYKIIREYKKFTKGKNYDIIHSFDNTSFILSKFIGKTHLVLNKCGGPNLNKLPHTYNLILFSTENYNYYKAKKNLNDSKIHLIPNRVKPFNCDQSLIYNLKQELNLKDEDYILLRIGRIDNGYEKSIKQSILLLNKIQIENPETMVKLLIVGSVLSNHTYTELLHFSQKYKGIHYITTDKYIKNAKLIIDIADIVIGTGRGFMEACSKNKLLFAPVHNNELPILVNKNNIKYFIDKNFSERTYIPEFLKTTDYSIKSFFNIKNDNIDFTNYIYNHYFNIEIGVFEYLKVYKLVLENEIQKAKWDINSIYYLLLTIKNMVL